ncbi:ATP-binding protein [Paraferrimonas haliotis]|uniref:ATP-binding protein n=1 Tax=Paraferrimonas haliotis TaxID=2013866 RepID=UPI000BA8EDFC|nr:ATP-binding protein [Paraferrimonas haliotis]
MNSSVHTSSAPSSVINRWLTPLLALQALLFSVCVAAEIDWSDYDSQTLSTQSIEVKEKIDSLPEPHLASKRDLSHAANLLSYTFSQVASQRGELSESLKSYHQLPSEQKQSAWEQIETQKLSLDSLNHSKAWLLKYVSSDINNRYTGFGPDGVRQLWQEVAVTQTIVRYQFIAQLRNLITFAQDLRVSPVPAILVVIKILLVFGVLKFWLKAGHNFVISRLELAKQHPRRKESLSTTFWRYANRIHKPLAWLIAIHIVLLILLELPGFSGLSYVDIIVRWSFTAVIVIKLVTEFASFHSHSNNISGIVQLRMSTIKLWVWTGVFVGIILTSTKLSVNEGTIYSWVQSSMLLIFLVILVKTLVSWRSVVFQQVNKMEDAPPYIHWAIDHQKHWLLSPVATAIGMVVLIRQRLFFELYQNLSQYQMFKHALAYLFRVEVAKQSQIAEESQHMKRIKGDEAFNYIAPGHQDSTLVEDYGKEQLNELSRYVLANIPAMVMVCSERGLGLTTFLKRLLYRSKSEHGYYINCPHGGFNELLKAIKAELGMPEDATEIELVKHLRKAEHRILLCIDNSQRLVSPKVGGLSELMKFTKLVRRGRNNHGVVLGIDQSTWRFIDRARGERLLFDKVLALPRWSEQQIADLLQTRIAKEGEHAISFAGLKLPKQWDEQDLTEEERAEMGFYRILWDYSDGNPTVALRFFRMSLHRDKTDDQVYVRIFKAPDAKELETMPKPMLAVLRAIVQLEVASAEELSDCTQLSFSEVLNTLRYFQNRGFIELLDDKAKISSHWFRYITDTLHNQHLLVK